MRDFTDFFGFFLISAYLRLRAFDMLALAFLSKTASAAYMRAKRHCQLICTASKAAVLFHLRAELKTGMRHIRNTLDF